MNRNLGFYLARCVNASGWEFLTEGKEYTICSVTPDGVFVKTLEQPLSEFAMTNWIMYDWIPADRFKIILD